MSKPEGVELTWVDSLCRFHGWPHEVGEAAFDVFDARIFNGQSRTFKSLNRRIQHALAVWEDKYGPLSEDQERYAGKVLAWAILQGGKEAGPDRSKQYPYVLHALATVVNHDRVDAGFKRRSDDGAFDLSMVLRRVPA